MNRKSFVLPSVSVATSATPVLVNKLVLDEVVIFTVVGTVVVVVVVVVGVVGVVVGVCVVVVAKTVLSM